jgi:hypothetical protein
MTCGLLYFLNYLFSLDTICIWDPKLSKTIQHRIIFYKKQRHENLSFLLLTQQVIVITMSMASRIYFKFVSWEKHNICITIVHISPKWSWIILHNTYKRTIFGCVSFYEFLWQNLEYMLHPLINHIRLRINTD